MESELINPFYVFCHHCKFRKRITLSVKCKCENIFCFKCKYPEIHGCTFDYPKNNQKELSEKLIKKEAKKINKII